MSGHGWVIPNADGSKARCGGPGICSACALEYVQKNKHKLKDIPEVRVIYETTEHIINAGNIAYKIRLEMWPEGLVLWVSNSVVYKSWEK